MAVYDSAAIYIECKTSTRDKIKAIDAIIDALLVTAAKAAGNEDVTEYQLNDGQTTIKTVYRGSSGVMKAINDFRALRQQYVNSLNGRVSRAVHSTNFRGPRYGR